MASSARCFRIRTFLTVIIYIVRKNEVEDIFSFFHGVVCYLSIVNGPQFPPFWIYPFVKIHAYGVHLIDWSIKVRLEVSMGT